MGVTIPKCCLIPILIYFCLPKPILKNWPILAEADYLPPAILYSNIFFNSDSYRLLFDDAIIRHNPTTNNDVDYQYGTSVC